MTYPLDADDLADKEALARLETENGFRDGREVVHGPADGDSSTEPPGLRDGPLHA